MEWIRGKTTSLLAASVATKAITETYGLFVDPAHEAARWVKWTVTELTDNLKTRLRTPNWRALNSVIASHNDYVPATAPAEQFVMQLKIF